MFWRGCYSGLAVGVALTLVGCGDDSNATPGAGGSSFVTGGTGAMHAGGAALAGGTGAASSGGVSGNESGVARGETPILRASVCPSEPPTSFWGCQEQGLSCDYNIVDATCPEHSYERTYACQDVSDQLVWIDLGARCPESYLPVACPSSPPGIGSSCGENKECSYDDGQLVTLGCDSDDQDYVDDHYVCFNGLWTGGGFAFAECWGF